MTTIDDMRVIRHNPAGLAGTTVGNPVEELQALLSEHNADMVLGELGEGNHGCGARIRGRMTLIFPTNQDPAVRLNVARQEVARLQATAAERTPETPVMHYPWCVTDKCTVRYDEDGVAFVEHNGGTIEIPAPDGSDDPPLIRSEIGTAEDCGPLLYITFGGGDLNGYDATQADKLIADLKTFTRQLECQRNELGDEPVMYA